MSYCPKCGKWIDNEATGCSACGIVNDTVFWDEKSETSIHIPPVSPTVETIGERGLDDFQLEEQRKEAEDYFNSYAPGKDKEMIPIQLEKQEKHTNTNTNTDTDAKTDTNTKTANIPIAILKIAIIAAVVYFQIFGSVVSIVGGKILQKNTKENLRQFGNTLYWLGLILFGLYATGWAVYLIRFATGSFF